MTRMNNRHPVRLFVLVMTLLTAGIASGETNRPASRETLLIDHVPTALLRSNYVATIAPYDFPARLLPEIDASPVAPRDRSAGARWQRFQVEFGVQKPSRSCVKGSLQQAKSQLDEKLFVIKDFLDHDLKFDYAVRDLVRGSNGADGVRRSRDNPILGVFDNARLRSDISLGGEDKTFVGIKLVLPISD